MKKSSIQKCMICCAIALTTVGCGKAAPNIVEITNAPETVVSSEFKEEWIEDGIFTNTYYIDNSKNSPEGRYLNFISFSDDATTAALEKLKVDIIVNDEIIESFEINHPDTDDIYCISPVIENLPDNLETYEVKFTANDSCTWTRLFNIIYDGESLHVNVILLDEENGFESVLAG